MSAEKAVGMNRLNNLDYLRGLAAFSIMCFHYTSWSYSEPQAATFIGRLGIYGVAIFYILSGLTLHYVYQNKMKPSLPDIKDFARKRFFRIFPLLWLVTIATIVLSRQFPDILKLVLNLTGLFGLVQWDKYFAVGVWSIGNELVFYLFLPLYFFLYKKHKPGFLTLSGVTLFIYLLFAFHILDPAFTLASQWRNYVNPLNQVFLFLSGFCIIIICNRSKFAAYLDKPVYCYGLLILGLAIFIFYPCTGDAIHLVTGLPRLIFTASCFLVCLAVFKLPLRLPKFIHSPLSLLGEASYSVYLLHPLVYGLVNTVKGKVPMLGKIMPLPVVIATAIVATLVISYFVYAYFEKFFMKIGKRTKLQPEPGL